MAISKANQSGWGIIGAVGAAVAASACCTVPLVLVSIGMGGAWMSSLAALEPFRPFFIVLAVGSMGFAFTRSYRARHSPECDCETGAAPRTKHVLLGIGALATVGLVASPWLLHAGAAIGAPEASNMQEITLDIEGMTCPGCTTTVTVALRRTEGVLDVHVSYAARQAVVRYDPSRVDVDALIAAITNTGYPARRASHPHETPSVP